MKKNLLLLFLFLLFLPMLVQAQKVGLVLSGGGAKGLTHIGIIRALEENNIPIDYYLMGSSHFQMPKPSLEDLPFVSQMELILIQYYLKNK